MTVKECYDRIGGGYDGAKSRLPGDTRIAGFSSISVLEQCLPPIREALKKICRSL